MADSLSCRNPDLSYGMMPPPTKDRNRFPFSFNKENSPPPNVKFLPPLNGYFFLNVVEGHELLETVDMNL